MLDSSSDPNAAGVIRAAAVYLEAWESQSCPVCGSAKWKHFPFCRHCSIRLQRIGLMTRFPARGTPARVIFRSKFFRRWTRYYDLCRDWLIVSKRSPRHAPDL